VRLRRRLDASDALAILSNTVSQQHSHFWVSLLHCSYVAHDLSSPDFLHSAATQLLKSCSPNSHVNRQTRKPTLLTLRTALLLANGTALGRVFGDDDSDHSREGDDARELHFEGLACLRGLIGDC
jgi:hypothetical protein